MSDDQIQQILSALIHLREQQVDAAASLAELRRDFLAELGTTRAAIMERVDRLENGINGVRDDIAVSMGSSEAVRRMNENTRADMVTMNEQVSVMWKQIKTLQSQMRELRGDP